MARKNSADSGLYKKTVLKNGLRVLTEKMPSVRSISMGVWIDIGSRNESKSMNGASHLIEHMLFKGTKKRTAKQIASSLESIGGGLNAFTSKEQTCYTARILDEHLDIAIDVLSDITCNATLTPVNLKREKKVICEEILESEETPSDHIHDIFAESYWGDHPLGRSILGPAENITNMPRAKIVNYIKENYQSNSIVIAAAGNVSHAKLVKLVKEKFNFPSGNKPEYTKAKRTKLNDVMIENTKNNQIHICLGHPGVDYSDKNKMAALAVHVYLGGGMSSVLFQKIREEKGLAYTVYTYLDMYRDAGLFGTYLATDKTNLEQALAITLKELDKVKKKKISASKLDLVKAQLKGHLTLGMESTSSRMSRLARTELMAEEYHTLKHTLKTIDKVTPSIFLEMVNKIFDNSQMALAVLGPADSEVIKNVVR